MSSTTQRWVSALALLIANAIPLCAVLFWGWPLGKLMALYWAETAVIGVFNVFRILMVGGAAGVPLALFFCVHFGGFMFVHGIFVAFLFFEKPENPGPGVLLDMAAGVRWELLALVISHGISFVVYWIFGNEAQNRSLGRQMMAPYGRIIVMHMTILAGGFAVMVLGQPAWVLVLFVVLKVAVDLAAHLREHRAS